MFSFLPKSSLDVRQFLFQARPLQRYYEFQYGTYRGMPCLPPLLPIEYSFSFKLYKAHTNCLPPLMLHPTTFSRKGLGSSSSIRRKSARSQPQDPEDEVGRSDTPTSLIPKLIGFLCLGAGFVRCVRTCRYTIWLKSTVLFFFCVPSSSSLSPFCHVAPGSSMYGENVCFHCATLLNGTYGHFLHSSTMHQITAQTRFKLERFT